MLQRLRTALAGQYRVERELGAGGMAVVFLAEDPKHRRKVAIKVLRPELAAALGAERFLREIEIAAGLQHPHVLPVFDSGQASDLLYYVMPFVEGESLSTRIAREGALPVDWSVRILREVADALAHAHERGLVHRDIKPDNILLSGNHALVADFGIARALRASAGATLTATGISLGTPSYMSPEQASGEAIDHRTDIYALGVVAYEMLAGVPPFQGRTAQAIVGAHISQPVPPLAHHRPGLPPVLAGVVMKCLEKHPADRVQSAAELVQLLEGAVVSGSHATVPTAPTVSTRRVALLFALCALLLLALTYGLMVGLGLPSWVFPAAVVLLVVGPLIVLTTSRAERQQHPRGILSWRRAIGGGALAFGVLGVAVAGYMAMRRMGIGPVGTLVASGRLTEYPRVILAEFVDRSGDSVLAGAVTEAFRVDLGQSGAVELVQGAQLDEALARMQRERTSRLSEELARDVATREGIPALVTGEINQIGGSYVISAKVVDASSGEVLAPLRETARDSSAIIPAVDRLSRKVRERIGESLRSIRESPPLARVTTSSLPALRLYTMGARALESGEVDAGLTAIREAIALDTAFAAAYSTLAATLGNFGVERAAAADAREKAFRYRGRLTERERLWTEGSYYMRRHELDQARTAYSALLGTDPDSGRILNNLGVIETRAGRPDRALAWYERAFAFQPDMPNASFNVVASSLDLGRVEHARAARARFAALRPGHPQVAVQLGMIGWAMGEYDSVATALDMLGKIGAATAAGRRVDWVARLGAVRGQPSSMEAILAVSDRRAESGRQVGEHLRAVLLMATFEAVVMGRSPEAARRVERALGRFPLASLDPLDRPYLELAEFYARADRPARASELLAEFRRMVPSEGDPEVAASVANVEGYIALAEGRAAEAARRFEAANVGQCRVCVLPGLARTWQAAGNDDSAVAVLERYLTTPDDDRERVDPLERAGALARLGELYEQRGDTAEAVTRNAEFLALWKDADPVFKPVLDRVRERQRRLTAEP